MRREHVHVIAQTLCECEGKDWTGIIPAERDRYARIAILIDDKIRQIETGQAPPDQTQLSLSPRNLGPH